MRDWRVAHGPGLHGPPAGARPRIPSLERLQIDPETCVVTNPLGAPIFVPYPAVHMWSWGGHSTTSYFVWPAILPPWQAGSRGSRPVRNIDVSVMRVGGTALVP
jgi:hypothetical protein